MPRAVKITKPVQIVQDVQSLRFVQNVNRKPTRSRTDADAFKLFQLFNRCAPFKPSD